MVERRLDHPALPSPEFTFAHHKAVTEEQSNAFDRLAFCVVLPVRAEDMLCILRGADHIYVSAVDRSFVDVSVSPEMIIDPTQELLSCAVLFGGAWWNSATSGCRHLLNRCSILDKHIRGMIEGQRRGGVFA